MDRTKFVAPETGELVKVSGLQDAEWAFIPAPLPPSWKWPDKSWPILMQAHRALASLDGIGTHLPDPQLILRPLQFREAVRSSSLEGTYTPPIQQALFEFDPESIDENEPSIDSFREISNYGQALRSYFDSSEKIPLSSHLIRQLHGVLLRNVRGGNKEPGQFRKTQNQIGRPPRFVPPPPDRMIDCLKDLEEYLCTDLSRHASFHEPLTSETYDPLYDPLINAFLVHYQFETIHPFLDGNGRVGRLLLSIMITESCGMSAPWLQMSPYFDANKDEYIDSLLAVSTQGKWNEWIRFCLKGVVTQAQDAHTRCTKLIEMQQAFRHKLTSAGGAIRLASIVDELFRIPVVTIPWVAKQYGVSYPTARKDINNLVDAGILEEWQERTRPKTFICPDIITVIYE